MSGFKRMGFVLGMIKSTSIVQQYRLPLNAIPTVRDFFHEIFTIKAKQKPNILISKNFDHQIIKFPRLQLSWIEFSYKVGPQQIDFW